MRWSEKNIGVRASLIDRLIDNDPSVSREIHPFRTLSRKELRASVARDLLWLLNTRTSIPESLFLGKELTVIDYGIPDFGKSSPANPDDHEFLVKTITKAVSAFEPRLRNVRVSVRGAVGKSPLDGGRGGTPEKSLYISIEAVIVIDMAREPVSFRTIFQKDTGTWELYDSEA